MSGLVRAYMGVSPALAEELCVGAGVEPSSSPDQLSSEQWQRLYQGWSTWLERLHSRTFVASSCPETGKFSALGSYSQQHDCVHDMLDDYYRSIQAVEVYAVLHQRLAGAVRQALKKGRGRLKSFDQQMAAAEDAAAVQRQADIIVANMYR
jgi:predicted ribosome quality control (RQC) complex YloA/Tae2 family protein